MKRPDRILVPVDLSETSLEALEFAALLAQGVSAALVVVSVLESRRHEPLPAICPEGCTRGECLELLFRDRLGTLVRAPAARIDHKVLVRRGKPVEEILRAAEEENADMIVMGTHGRSGLARALLGSVTEQVIRRAPCPVLAIRGRAARPEESTPTR